MITKDRIFASAGSQNTTATGSDFSTGMIPNTVAMAEDVNTYGNMSDKDLWVVCQELVNLLANFGISPNNSYDSGQQNQIAQMFQQNVTGAYSLTGIIRSSFSTAPTQNGTQITFPSLGIAYNLDVYYGNTQARIQETTLQAQTLSATSGWADGVHYIYATTTPSSSTSTLGHQQTPVLASDGATKCMLGSVFVINGNFQPNTWKFQPWLQVTPIDSREAPTAQTKGGFISPYQGTELQMGYLQILDEGINFGANPNMPNIMSVSALQPFTYKYLYPDYNPSSSELTDVDTTHLYNMTSGTWDDISSLADGPTPKFIVVVPCITPTGQTLLIPAMSTKTGETYNQVFDSQAEAASAIFSLPYAATDTYASRVIYLGQSLVLKVGATDFTDPEQYMAVGMLPQALAGFSDAAGQSGGGAGAYIPMPEITWTGYTTINAQNNAANVVIGDTNVPLTINPPEPSNNIINQFSIKYVHTDTSQGISWNTSLEWWGNPPTLVVGNVYNIIFEYINGAWIGGILTKVA